MDTKLNRWVSGALFAVLGAIIAFGPQFFFKPCSGKIQVHNNAGEFVREVPMKCHWTTIVALGIGLAIVAIGVMMFFFDGKQVRKGLSLALAPLGALMVLVASEITPLSIGVCGNTMMECNKNGLAPALMVLGILVFVASLANVYILRKKSEE